MSGPVTVPAVPPGYERWTADEKATWLWDRLIGDTVRGPAELAPLVAPFSQRPVREAAVVLRKPELRVTLDAVTDVMPPGRPKVIHARGTVAMVRLETDPASPFTGLLAPPDDGGAIGLIRISLVMRVGRNASFTPGIGLKLLVDGHPSADVVAVNHTVGQGRDFDLFSNTMTNDLTEEHGELRPPQRMMNRLFSRVTAQPRRLTSAHLAARRADGVAVDVPVAPRRLVFRPAREVSRLFDGKVGIDFRQVLAAVGPGTPVYDLEGVVGPTGAGETHRIGRIVTTTGFRASDGGDALFFRHVQD